MICPECGHRNAAGVTFCSSCQGFLQWEDDDAQVAAPAAPAPTAAPDPVAPPPAPAAGPRPAVSPVPVAQQRSPADAPAPAAQQAPPTVPMPAAPVPTAPLPGASVPAAAMPAAPSAPAPAASAAPPVQPAPSPIPLVAPRRPGDAITGPAPDIVQPRTAAEEERPAGAARIPAELICPHCRTGNPVERTLCVRCGGPLDVSDEPKAVQPPWWRRLFKKSTEYQPPVAGTRPRSRTWRRPSLSLPVLLVLLLVGAWFGRSHFPEFMDFTKDQTTRPVPLHPQAARASSETGAHPATSAFDGYSNRYWSPSQKDGKPYLEADFERPVRLRNILVFAGTSAKQDEFLKEARPAAVTVTMTDTKGDTSKKTIELSDKPGQQTFGVRGSNVVKVRLTVDEVFGKGSGRELAVAEVEFFGRYAQAVKTPGLPTRVP